MAQFTGKTGTGATVAGKWEPGKRGRPPKDKQTLTNGADLPREHDRGTVNETPVDPELSADSNTAYHSPGKGAGAGQDPRANPATYPRRENGMPITPYRVVTTEDDMVRFFAAMRPDDWAHCELYIYQTFPKMISRKDQGENNYIEKHGEWTCDLDAFIEAYGSGQYDFTLNDSNVGGNRRTVMYAQLKLNREEYPIKYNLAMLDVWHKNNANLRQQLLRDGLIDERGNPVANENGNAATIQQLTAAVIDMSKERARTPVVAPDPNGAAMAAVHTETIKMLGAANKAAIEAATAGNKDNGPTALLQVVTVLKDLIQPTPAPNNDAVLQVLLKQIESSNRDAAESRKEAAEERKRQHELQMKAMEQKATATDPMAQFKTFVELKNLLGGGVEAMAPKNWKEMAIGMVGDHLPQVLEMGTAIFQSMGKPTPVQPNPQPQPQPNPGNNQLPPGQQTVDVQAQPNPNQPNPTPQQPPQPNHQPATPHAGPNMTPEQVARITHLQDVIGKYGSFFVNAMRSGKSGYEFADSLITMTDQLTYDKYASFTQDEWLTALFSFPQLAQQFQGAEQVVATFIFEFLDPTGGEGNGDAEPNNPMDPGNLGDEPPPPTKPKRTKKAAN